MSFSVRERKIVGHGWTQDHTVLENINEEIVRYLSSREEGVKATAENKTTLLHWAVSVGCEEIIKILLSKILYQRKRIIYIDPEDSDDDIPLYVAKQENFLQLFSFPPRLGAEIEGESAPNNYGTKDGYHWLLMDDDADVNAKDEHGRSPLHIALRNGREEIAKLLVNIYRARVNTKDTDGSTPLHYAVRQEWAKMSKFLLKIGADADTRDVDGTSPLHIAASTRSFKIASLLIENGADFNAIDKHGKIPLHYAVARERVSKKAVEILLDAGSDVNILDNQGCTPISIYLGKSNIYRLAKRYSGRACEVSRCYRPLIRLFKLHTLKLRAAGLYVNQTNVQLLKRPGCYTHITPETGEWTRSLARELHHHLPACKEELEKMKGIKLVPKVSIYDIMKIDDSRHKLVKTLVWNSKWLSEEFPIYKGLLEDKFININWRFRLLENSRRSFNSLVGTFLPFELQEKILSYLDNEDLKNLMRCDRD